MTDETDGTFLVTHAGTGSAVLKDVEDGQVHTLADNPDLETGEILEATLVPEPPLEVTWRVAEVAERRRIAVEESDEPPTQQARDIAAGQDVGELTRRERAGKGEIHVLTVPPEQTAEAVADVREDDGTLARAARLPDVSRVEVRAADGVVSVRYLP